MKPLKIEIDRPTMGCLLSGMQELAIANLRTAEANGEEMDYESSCTYNLLREFFVELRDRAAKDELFFKSKIRLPLALALRMLILRTPPLDAWSNAELIRIGDELDRYIIAALREQMHERQAAGVITAGDTLKLN